VIAEMDAFWITEGVGPGGMMASATMSKGNGRAERTATISVSCPPSRRLRAARVRP